MNLFFCRCFCRLFGHNLGETAEYNGPNGEGVMLSTPCKRCDVRFVQVIFGKKTPVIKPGQTATIELKEESFEVKIR